jgi:alpha-ribazole phosphatase
MDAFVLHLLRHGEPELPGRMMGRTDGAPTVAGIGACVEQVRDLAVESIVSSDLCRASLAAQVIGRDLGLPVAIDRRWRELDFGVWDGLLPGEIDQAALGRFWDDPDAHAPPEGERWSRLLDRVARAVDGLEPRTTLVVTHGGTMRAALHLLCGFGQQQIWAFDLPYASLLSLRVWPGDRPSAQICGLRP